MPNRAQVIKKFSRRDAVRYGEVKKKKKNTEQKNNRLNKPERVETGRDGEKNSCW